MRFLFALTLAVFSATFATAATYRDQSVPMSVVTTLDLERYLGKWYEIARFPNRFEKGCTGVTAEYAIRPDGKVSVINTCHEDTPTGPMNRIEGQAWVKAPGKLTVTFVPWLPFARGDYWVLHVEPDYSMAVVGEPKGKTGWILARGKSLSPAKTDRAMKVLEKNGYDTTKLYRVPQ